MPIHKYEEDMVPAIMELTIESTKIKFGNIFNSRGIMALAEHTTGANLKKQLIVL